MALNVDRIVSTPTLSPGGASQSISPAASPTLLGFDLTAWLKRWWWLLLALVLVLLALAYARQGGRGDRGTSGAGRGSGGHPAKGSSEMAEKMRRLRERRFAKKGIA